MSRSTTLLAGIAAAVSVAACATLPVTSTQVATRTVEVTATYRERILLPPGHELHVALSDVSLADAPAPVLAEARVALEGRAPPYVVTLMVPTQEVRPERSYAVRAEIRDPEGRLRFTTDTRHSVLTQGAPDRVEIVMVGAAGPR